MKAIEVEQSLTWRLSDQGMDLLERAGLAGLYMALQSASKTGSLSPLSWHEDDLRSDSVTVRWSGPAKPGFVKLMDWAWQLSEGLLYLPGVHDDRDRAALQYRVPMHSGIMRTFLQHPNTQPKLEAVDRVIEVEEDKTIVVRFEPPAARVDDPKRGNNPKTKRLYKKKIAADCLKPHTDLEKKKFFDRAGCFSTNDVSLSNWVYPGIAGRYGDEKSWDGPATIALLLMLAPTVCLYHRLQGEGGNWVFVVPDVRDVEEFAATRRLMNLNADFIDVASLGDAGLQFLAEYSTRSPRKVLGSGCRVVAMGYVGYYQGQSIRKSVLDIPPDLLSVRRYRILHRELPNTFVRLKTQSSADVSEAPKTNGQKKKADKSGQSAGDGAKATGFIKLPSGRGRIADNLVRGWPWYADLAIPTGWDHDELERERKRNKELNDRDGKNRPTSHETILFAALGSQRRKLMKLIAEDDMWDTEAERVFVEAFWEALDSLYAQEAAAIERGGTRTIEDRFKDLNDDIRRRLTQAKTRALLRTVLADLFAKAGRQKSIRNHPAAIWRLIDHPDHWRKGRDLALLALTSHRKKEEREAAATSTAKGA
ncbi:MAG: type I-MYXAN CRISPR-associated Cas8a1/Cmx1 [Verrucomicrobia bacterium]|nr:type I-MYXAN CRISPR-associated Cas8a1/Cmx1 [Verrucomicrobiota bacterium]